MAPNIPLDRPLAETLTHAPQTYRDPNEHGSQKVISTYSKKEEPSDMPFATEQLSKETLLHLKEDADSEPSTTTEKKPNESSDNTEALKFDPSSRSELVTSDPLLETVEHDKELHREKSQGQISKEKIMEIIWDSDEQGSVEEQFGEYNDKEKTKQREDSLKETESAGMKKLDLQSNDRVMTPINPLHPHIKAIWPVSQSEIFPTDVRNLNLGFDPMDFSHQSYHLNRRYNVYNYPSPIINNDGVYYATFPSHVPLSRELSRHPVVKIEEDYSGTESSAKPIDENLPATTTSKLDSEITSTITTRLSESPELQPTSTTSSSLKPPQVRPTSSPKIQKSSLPSDTKIDFVRFDEELADFSNLYHHQKSLEELAANSEEVAVKEDDWIISADGATAVILVGMCSIILVLICFMFLLKRYTKAKGEEKLREDNIEEKKYHDHHDHLKEKPSLWLDLYNPVNLIPHIEFLHTLPQVATHSKEESSETPEQSAAGPSVFPIPPFMNVKEFAETNLGRLWFTVRYDTEKLSLHVNLRHARYPKGREISNNTGDLWVECALLTELNTVKASSKSTSRRATPSPVFNHTFLFLLGEDEVASSILRFVMHDKHPKKEVQAVGSVILPLSSIDLKSNEILCRDLL